MITMSMMRRRTRNTSDNTMMSMTMAPISLTSTIRLKLLLIVVATIAFVATTTAAAVKEETTTARIEKEQASTVLTEQQQEEHHERRMLRPLRSNGNGANLSVLTSLQQKLPPAFNNVVSDLHDGYNATVDTPLFWKISKTGATISLQPYLMDCLNLIVANEMGGKSEETKLDTLEVIELPNERRFINVDTTTLEGLSDNKVKHLASSKLANVVISPLLNHVLQLFDSTHKAKLFTMIRHPVYRTVSQFYSQQAKGVYTDMTLPDYASSSLVEGNYMVRTLVGKPTEHLTPSDLYTAKTLLRQKFLIGLSDKMEESLQRFATYFQWDTIDHYRLGVFQRHDECKQQYLSDEHIAQLKVQHEPVVEGSEEWNLLVEKNWADIALYESALDVYRQQTTLFQPGGVAYKGNTANPVQPQL